MHISDRDWIDHALFDDCWNFCALVLVEDAVMNLGLESHTVT